jgi:cobalt-zinc-cadmium efflux system outer membrane protein
MTKNVSKSLLLAGVGLVACVPGSAHDRASLSKALTERGAVGLRGAGLEFSLPPEVVLEDGVTEDEAVASALWNNGRFQVDLAALGFARADLIDAGMIRNPLFTLLTPLGPKQLEMTAWLPIEALWQRPKRVAAAETEVERVASSLVQTGLDLVRDTKVAFAEATLASERSRLAGDAAALRARLLAIAEARRRSGDVSELELTAVRLDALRAEQDVLRLAREELAARERLAAVMGAPLERLGSLELRDPEARETSEPSTLVKEALALRPDLRAAELAIEAAQQRGGAALAASFPQVNLIADANGAGTQGFEAGPGLQAELPIFNQGQGPRARAEVDLERAQWSYVATQQRITLEVRQAQGRYLLAQEALALLRTQLLGELDVAGARAAKAYAAGEISLLALLDTTRQQLEAHQREVELVAEVRRAAAELDRSIGRKRVR